MKISELTRLLDGLSMGLTDLSAKTADGIAAIAKGIEPFAEKTVEQFVQFLKQCEEFQRTGVVATGKKAAAPKSGASAPALGATEAANKFRALLSEINEGTVTTPKIDALMNQFNAAMKKPDLDQLLTMVEIAGKSKSKADAIDKLRMVLVSQTQMYAKTASF